MILVLVLKGDWKFGMVNLLDVRFRVVCKGRILSWGPFGFFVV